MLANEHSDATTGVIYLDHAASSPMTEAALLAYEEAARLAWGNPSSGHQQGQRAKEVLERARARLAALWGLAPPQVVFTSGATEAANWAVAALARREGRVLATRIEHAAVRRPLEALGGRVEWLALDGEGRCDLSSLAASVEEGPPPAALVLMGANNETGVIQPVAEATELVRRAHPETLVVSDLVALAPYRPIGELLQLIDVGFISAHKLGGPIGLGVLVRRPGLWLDPLLVGGEQELGLRSGTVPAPLAAATARAVADLTDHLGEIAEVTSARQCRLESRLAASGLGLEVVGGKVPRVGITSLVVRGVRAEELLFVLDEAGVAASGGAACASGALEPSPVLVAMGYRPEEAASQLRLSFAASTTEAEVDEAAARIVASVQRLRAR
jgi:cysteine desulfurase